MRFSCWGFWTVKYFHFTCIEKESGISLVTNSKAQRCNAGPSRQLDLPWVTILNCIEGTIKSEKKCGKGQKAKFKYLNQLNKKVPLIKKQSQEIYEEKIWNGKGEVILSKEGRECLLYELPFALGRRSVATVWSIWIQCDNCNEWIHNYCCSGDQCLDKERLFVYPECGLVLSLISVLF